MTRTEIIKLAEQISPSNTPDIQFLERFVELLKEYLVTHGYRKCAVGQKTTQWCGMYESLKEKHGHS